MVVLLLCITPVFSTEGSTLKVKIEGVNQAQEQNILSLLSIQQLHQQEITNPGRMRYLHNKASAEISKALQPYGFYRPEIIPQLTKNNEDWLAHYRVTPGPAIPIGSLDIQVLGEAQQDDPFKKLLAATPLSIGAPLIHEEYESLKRGLLSLATERGYYQARFIQHYVEVNLERYQANISLHFDSGPRFTVGELRFTPNPLTEDFLRRYVPFKTGDPMQSSALIDLQSNLIDSDYFQRVEVQPLWSQADGINVPIEVAVEAHKRTKYQAGVGYGTDTGARVKLGMTRRWVNNRGHQFNTQLLASQIHTGLTAEYAIPGLQPQHDRYTVHLKLNNENSTTVDADNYSFGTSWQHQGLPWKRVLSLEWQQERFDFDGPSQTTQFLIPRISLTRLSTGDRLNIRNGQRYSLQLLGASDDLLSDTNFVQLRLGTKVVRSLTPNWRLLGRADAGVTAVDSFDQLPATLRFFAGGDNSVRGYDYQSLGPRNNEGTLIGGPHLLTASAELEYRLSENWGLATFIDSGDAFEDTDIHMQTGIGVGLRWFSPIGPVRLDLAFPQNDDGGFQLHFSLGPDL
ncbi:hypothetical protein BGP75_01155 [Motiliproteus sp. MSK22-1]|nr:hypothetical protein BGP75_01155 [Motiliproteus sp. MSK22-1]